MNKHTPGPWTAQRSGRNERMLGKKNWNPDDPHQCALAVYARSKVCTLADEYGTDAEERAMRAEQEANAHLIAAAPDLLAALREYLERHEASCEPSGLPEYEQARAAIAKAEGRNA